MIAYELLHTMKSRQRGKEGNMAIKLDMSKAYDRVELEFWEAMLVKLAFGLRCKVNYGVCLICKLLSSSEWDAR